MSVSKNNGTPKSSILIGSSLINHPFWGTPIFGNSHILMSDSSSTAGLQVLASSDAMQLPTELQAFVQEDRWEGWLFLW